VLIASLPVPGTWFTAEKSAKEEITVDKSVEEEIVVEVDGHSNAVKAACTRS